MDDQFHNEHGRYQEFPAFVSPQGTEVPPDEMLRISFLTQTHLLDVRFELLEVPIEELLANPPTVLYFMLTAEEIEEVIAQCEGTSSARLRVLMEQWQSALRSKQMLEEQEEK